MKIVSVEPFGCDTLLAALARTRLRGYGGVRPYEQAELRLCSAATSDELAPAQNYVLRPGIRKILELRRPVGRGFGSFRVRWRGDVRTSGRPGRAHPGSPLIVEESLEPDGRKVLIINDGIHRLFAARSLNLPISVVEIRAVPADYPYYAYALRGGWGDVMEFDELPDSHQKKDYRQPGNYKALFRDFNEVFPGVQKQRKQSNPAHISE